MPTVAELTVGAEYQALEENARSMGWELVRLSPTSFSLTMPGRNGSLFSVLCLCDRYSAEPPAWHWYNTETKLIDQPSDTPLGGNFFHTNRVICAPWNRLAYKSIDSRGPHDDWVIGDWRANKNTGACKTLSAMAIRIAHELQCSLQNTAAAA